MASQFDIPYMSHETVHYYLPGKTRKRASTGEPITPVLGPYVVSILGGYWRCVTDAEVNAYVLNMHGTLPLRIERHDFAEENV